MKNKTYARLAGLSYLAIIVFGIISHMVIRANLIVKNQAMETAQAILEKENLFRFSIVSDFIMIIAFISLGIFLYKIFKDKFEVMSLFLLVLNILGGAMMGINMLNQLAAIEILDNSFEGLKTVQYDLSYFYLRLHSMGYSLSAISFGLWLFPMGYMIIKSSLFPKTIGILLILGSIGYMATFVGLIMGVNVPEFVTLGADLGEMSFCLYLLIKGIRT